ncbi:hypothetical protein CTI12_AA176610 [Artemisia annua]|uniref:Transposase MuDR plant domain-containing protein n=1 Tax=Artemisia annua TaxID=35608 RepID=A0A2U1P9C6_ARTAN|nr:hypothetical protein CTI12_AA176610 [Artemisia annua]
MDDQESSKFKVVLLHDCGKHAVKLPKDISYNNLLAYVKKKVDAAKGKVNADIRLSYKDGTMSLDIVDDDDVHYFIHDVCGNKDQPQKLFHILIRESSKFKVVLLHDCGKHAVKLPKDISYNNLLAYVKKKVDAAKGKVNADIRLSYKDGTMSLDIVDDDDVHYFIHDVCGNKDQPQKLFISLNSEVKSSYASNRSSIDLNIPLLPQQVNLPTPKVEPYSFHNLADSVPIWQKNSFTHMTLPPKAPNSVIKCVDRNIQVKKATTFHKYREFVNKADCMFNIGKKSLIERFEYLVIKSEPTRYSVKCTKQGCPWKIYTRRVNGGDQFYVSTVNDIHTCSRTEFCPNHRNATMKLLSQLLYDKMKDHSRVYTVRDIQTDLRVDWKIDLSYKRVWGGRNLSFELLNAHLKGKYKGTNLLVVGMDGNNQIIPIATGEIVRYLYWKSCKAYSIEVFERTVKQLRAKRPHAVKKLEEVGFDKWSRAFCPANRYNYLTSNSAESINALTRLVRKVPITMLMEYYRRLLQDWYCQRREKYIDAPEFELTDWAAVKVQQRMYKSENWEVRGIALCAMYQVIDHQNSHIVDFLKRECTCRSEGLTNCNQWALPWFTKTNLKGTYHEMVFPLPDQQNWHNPGNLPKLKPPVMVKKQSGRPKNKDRLPSKNEEPKVKQCGRCGRKSHTREACMQPLPKSENGKQPFDSRGVRKRKSDIEREVIIESNPGNETEVINDPNMEVDEEYFENGRIYADWDDLDWFGEPSANLYEGDEVWGGAASSSGINLNSYPESCNPYHLDDF